MRRGILGVRVAGRMGPVQRTHFVRLRETSAGSGRAEWRVRGESRLEERRKRRAMVGGAREGLFCFRGDVDDVFRRSVVFVSNCIGFPLRSGGRLAPQGVGCGDFGGTARPTPTRPREPPDGGCRRFWIRAVDALGREKKERETIDRPRRSMGKKVKSGLVFTIEGNWGRGFIWSWRPGMISVAEFPGR